MQFSIYPTDTPETRAAVVEQALRHGDEVGGSPVMFTSLHIPESTGLAAFGDELGRLHRDHGIGFCADISPATLARLGGLDETASRMRGWGVEILRIDFGFDAETIRAIAAASGCRIAVNASTVDAATLDQLDGLPLVGWHNYYPRPETGLTDAFYLSQNRLLASRGVPVLAFIPGEVQLRAPLHLGLPTLETHRHRNAWRNYLHLRRLSPDATIVCAEGTLLPHHAQWIAGAESTGEVVIPLADLDPVAQALLDGAWRIRVEEAESSLRLEETRGFGIPARVVNGDVRSTGSLQIDLETAGRYRGEVHLMRTDRPLSAWQARIGEIAGPYRGMIDDLAPGATVRFELVR